MSLPGAQELMPGRDIAIYGLLFFLVHGNCNIRTNKVAQAAGNARSVVFKGDIIIALAVGQPGEAKTALRTG